MTQTVITEKQQEIVTLIPRFRFLDRTHIKSLLHHKQKQRINKWLKDLTQKEYVRRIYDDSIIGKNRRAAIFSLRTNGIRFVNHLGIYDTQFLHKLYFENKRSETFIDHCLLIATICCELERYNNETVTYEYATENDLSRSENPYRFLKDADISADLVFSKKERGKKVKHFLLTLFDETLPKYRIRNRIRQYREFYFSNEWENTNDALFPRLLFLCATKELMIYCKRYARTVFAEEIDDSFSLHFATAADAKEHGVTGKIWEKV